MVTTKKNYNSLNKLIFCSGCNHNLATVKDLRSFRLSAVCRCGNLGVYNFMHKRLSDASHSLPVIHKGNSYFCGACEREILQINTENISQLSFTALCECGNLCSSQNIVLSVQRIKEKV